MTLLACGFGRLPNRLGSFARTVRVRIVQRFAGVLLANEEPTVVSIDIPIGRPDHIGREGRGPNTLFGRSSVPLMASA